MRNSFKRSDQIDKKCFTTEKVLYNNTLLCNYYVNVVSFRNRMNSYAMHSQCSIALETLSTFSALENRMNLHTFFSNAMLVCIWDQNELAYSAFVMLDYS